MSQQGIFLVRYEKGNQLHTMEDGITTKHLKMTP